MTSRFRAVLFVFTLVGLGAASASLYTHVQLLRDPSYVGACDVNATISCTTAYASVYGSLAGVPVALLGVCWFVGVLALLVSASLTRVPQPENVDGYVFALSVPALAFALYLAYAAFFVLHTVCLLCLATYLCLIGIFIVSGISTRFSMTTLPARLARDFKTLVVTPVALVIALLTVAGAASALAFFPREGAAAAPPNVSPQEQAQLEQFLDRAPRAMIPVDTPAPVVVVKFNDYQCPPCRQTYDMYKPIKAKYEKEQPGKVKWVTKDFPLDSECNAAIKSVVHQYACEAAAAVRMARKNSKAEAMEDWIFGNQPSLTLDGLKKAVRDIGGVADYDKQYPLVLTEVRGDTALGGILGVSSTPTFYINGVKLSALAPEYFDAAIAYELKKAKK
jgi:uncharacterized membrane protein/protein-disulfide isomerase